MLASLQKNAKCRSLPPTCGEMVSRTGAWWLGFGAKKGVSLAFVLCLCLGGREAAGMGGQSTDVAASSTESADSLFEKEVVLSLRRVPYDDLYQRDLTAKDRAYLCSTDGGGPQYVAADRAGNIYLTFGFLPEVRKYDREGRYIETYSWEVPKRQSAIWKILVGEEDESVYVFGGAGWQRKCKKFEKNGQENWIQLGEYLEKHQLAEDGGGLVRKKTGGRIAGSGGRDDETASWRRMKRLSLVSRSVEGHAVFEIGGSGSWSSRQLNYGQVGANISDAYLLYVDRSGCIFVLFGAVDPTLIMERGVGMKWWVAKYDRKVRYIGSLACEPAPRGPRLGVTPSGEVLELSGDGEFSRVLRWRQR